MLNPTHSTRVSHSLGKRRVALHPCMRSPIFLATSSYLVFKQCSMYCILLIIYKENILDTISIIISKVRKLGMQCVCDALIVVLIT